MSKSNDIEDRHLPSETHGPTTDDYSDGDDYTGDRDHTHRQHGLHQDLALAKSDISPTDPSAEVDQKRQSLPDLFSIICAGAALISDGYQNSLMTMTNVVLKAEYKKQYTSRWSTQVSNALLVGEILGQLAIGLTCDYMGRKAAIFVTTAMIVIGGILATAANGHTIYGMFWMLSTFLPYLVTDLKKCKNVLTRDFQRSLVASWALVREASIPPVRQQQAKLPTSIL